ncbi:hypothetical protein [Sphingomonas aerophila]|uniref:Uncharacterized protein n=1 Tax=Sphingomonas aerophila TaxID=1344948 RepID=A0A7W9BEA3_9SPHN|nr:hypothetical protein [Sphingomonas aerophila]MBB5715577.1 hypothetical protein [Sphingomonas aerophila]
MRSVDVAVDHFGPPLRDAFPAASDGTFYSMLAVLKDAEGPAEARQHRPPDAGQLRR